MRAALAIDLKDQLGIEEIEAREHQVTEKVLDHFAKHPELHVMGTAPADKRLSIVSFTVRYDEWFLHPRFVVRLLNDLFGIQARAGCSCAGPYGHRLLHIGAAESEAYRQLLRHGNEGVKPGWARMNFHYLFTDEEVNRLLAAVDFVAQYGYLFLQEYQFDLACGGWSHLAENHTEEAFGASAAADLAAARVSDAPTASAAPDWDTAMADAKAKAGALAATFAKDELGLTAEGTIRFWYRHGVNQAGCPD